MTREELGRAVYEISHLTGTFTLRSGLVSNVYFDKYRFESDPAILVGIAEHMKALIPEGTEVLAGLEMGGLPIAASLSITSGLPCAFVRKTAKTYGTCRLAEGADVGGKRVCVVEDVVTTGGQILMSVAELRALGAQIDTVLCAIQRGAVSQDFAEAGLSLKPLFTMEQLEKMMG